jgi:PAS domain S-box-containing protein
MGILQRLSFKNKILFSTLLIVVLLAMAVAAVVRWVLLPSLTTGLKARGAGIAQSIAGLSRGAILTGDRAMLTSMIFDEKQLEQRRDFVSYILILDKDQEVLAHTFIGELPDSILGANKPLPDQTRSIQSIRLPEERVFDIAVPVREGFYQIGTVRVGLNKAVIDRLIGKMAIIFLGSISVVLLIGFLLSQWLSKYITKPLVRLTDLAHEISRGNLDVSFDFGYAFKCWEILDCDKTDCPAHGNSHVACWYVEDTLCTGAPMGGFPGKLEECRHCKVCITHRGDEIAQLANAISHMTRDLRSSRNELKRIYDFQKNLIEGSIDGIVATDNKGNIVVFNEGAARIFGYPSEEAIGKMDMANLYPRGQGEKIQEDLDGPGFGGPGKLADYETAIENSTGKQVPVWLSASTISEGGEVLGVVAVLRDLTERKRLEERVLETQRLATIGQGVTYISHEIRNPLMIIGGFAQQVLKNTNQGDKNKKKLDIIINEIERLEEFLSDVTDLTKLSKPKMAMANMRALVEEVSTLLEHELVARRVVFDQVSDPHIPEALFDSKQMKQVLINVLKNSLEAMPDGGKLSVETHLRDKRIEIRVRDTGKGIAEEDLKDIFNPFVTTKLKGTGLGLAISRKIIEDHGGDMGIESTSGEGTVCTILLPLQGAA